MRRTFAIAVALTLGLSGCGATSSKPETAQEKVTKEVTEVVDSLAAAGTRRQAKTICTDILSKQLVAELKSAGGNCEEEMDRAIKDATDYDLQVVSVKANGKTATAQVRQGDKGPVATFTFVKEGDAWKASALGSS
jgi:Flp pilus assembly protein TadD